MWFRNLRGRDMKKLAIFDLDGTLYDTRDVNYHSYEAALEQYGYELDYKYFSNYCNGRHYKEFLPEIMRDTKHMEDVHNLKKKYYKDYLNKAKENEHLFQMVQCMKSDYYIAIVTTASRKNCEEILEYHNRLQNFDLIISSEDVNNKKPDPEGFLKAMEHFGVGGSQTVVFEDSDVGVEAAQKSGATVFVVKGFS